MATILASDLKTALGHKLRSHRAIRHMTQAEVAERAGVSVEEVDLFEHHLPVRLDAQRRLLKELWAAKMG